MLNETKKMPRNAFVQACAVKYHLNFCKGMAIIIICNDAQTPDYYQLILIMQQSSLVNDDW